MAITFEFINTSMTEHGKDGHTRSKVRAQAMRDYRQRQRSAREKGQHVVRELKPHGTRKRALEAPVPNPPDDGASIPVSQDAAKLNVDLMPAKRSRTSLCRPKLEQSREAQAPPLPVIRRPMGNLEDPFKSPIQVATMLRVCASWGELLRGPEFDILPTMKLVATAWEVAPTPMIVAASFLGAVGHLGALQPSRPRVNDALYRAIVLREVTARMRSPLTAASDMTISALMKLAAFEVCRLNPESATHISGLAKLIDMRGEKDKFFYNGTTMVVECLDLAQATLFNSKLVMASSFVSEDVEDEASSESLTRIASALITELQSDTGHLRTYDGKSLVEAFAALWKCAASCMRSNGDCGELEADRFFRCLDDFSRNHCEGDGSNDQSKAARACHQSMAIWYNLIVNHHFFDDSANIGYVNGLYGALESGHTLWRRHSFFRLFLLWTGMLASRNPTTRSFFVAHVPGTVHTLGYMKWPAAKAFILDILKLRHQLEHQARCASPQPTSAERTPNLERSQSPFDTSSSSSSTPHTPPPASLPTVPSTIKWQSLPRSTEEILASDHKAYNIISGGDQRRNLLGPFVSTLVTRDGWQQGPM